MHEPSTRRGLHPLAPALACLLVLGACASSPKEAKPELGSDPLEPVNRRVHAFNDGFDRKIGRPVAQTYGRVMPDRADRAVSNFFSNIDDISVLVNSALQLKAGKAMRTAARLSFNTTIGVLGLMNIAGKLGLPKEDEDFGQTLGYWGLGPGPYLVLPFLGPSGLRDGTGLVVDSVWYDPIDEVEDDGARYSLRLVNAVDRRAGMLGASRVIDTAAVDNYSYIRNAYLRRRLSAVHDGDPPERARTDRAGEGDFDPFGDEDDDLFEGDPGTAGQ